MCISQCAGFEISISIQLYRYRKQIVTWEHLKHRNSALKRWGLIVSLLRSRSSIR